MRLLFKKLIEAPQNMRFLNPDRDNRRINYDGSLSRRFSDCQEVG